MWFYKEILSKSLINWTEIRLVSRLAFSAAFMNWNNTASAVKPTESTVYTTLQKMQQSRYLLRHFTNLYNIAIITAATL